MHTIAVFGGTFDPVHNGHIQVSIAIQKQFHFDSYRFIPCKIPTLKPSATANSEQRITMLQLAIKQHPSFEIDLREIRRDTPSYMVDTLDSMRQENPEASITLILGQDAFISLPRWHEWEKIITLAHLLVINRLPHTHAIPETLYTTLNTHETHEQSTLLTQKYGSIYQFNAGDYPLSSTDIRAALKEQRHVSEQLPKEVYDYIQRQGLYCRQPHN